MFPAPPSRRPGQPTHPLFNDAALLSPTQDRPMLGTLLPQNPSPWRGEFKPCLALRRQIRHRLHRFIRCCAVRNYPPESSSTPVEEYDDDDREGDGSVMLYSLLVPSEVSEVELAASDIMSMFDDGGTLEFEMPAHPLSFVQAEEQHTPRSSSHTPAAGWFDTLKRMLSRGGS